MHVDFDLENGIRFFVFRLFDLPNFVLMACWNEAVVGVDSSQDNFFHHDVRVLVEITSKDPTKEKEGGEGD
jgi:hypothetical protein